LSNDSRWRLEGVSIFTFDDHPCRLDYVIDCDPRWSTIGAEVSGWVGEERVDIEVSVDGGRWTISGRESLGVNGCTDIDLSFSPATNLLPIRRLELEVGTEAPVRAAWLRFPSFRLEPLDQVYRRLDAGTYRYSSGGGKFVADLKVNAAGFVTLYPDFWVAEPLATC